MEKEGLICSTGDEARKKYTYLGYLLYTEEDIERLKELALDACNTFKTIFNSKYISKEVRVRTSLTYIQNIFPYNSKLQRVTKTKDNDNN